MSVSSNSARQPGCRSSPSEQLLDGIAGVGDHVQSPLMQGARQSGEGLRLKKGISPEKVTP